MEITNPNYNTMPEQVNQNTKDIAVLKNTVKTPATIYNATVEMAQDAGVINQSNIMQQVTNTANAFVMDTVGKLFRIVTVENNQVYVAYCASIRGPQGANGANGANGVGIQSITSIAPTQDDGYTVTPVTFTDTDENQITLNVRAKNGENSPKIYKHDVIMYGTLGAISLSFIDTNGNFNPSTTQNIIEYMESNKYYLANGYYYLNSDYSLSNIVGIKRSTGGGSYTLFGKKANNTFDNSEQTLQTSGLSSQFENLIFSNFEI